MSKMNVVELAKFLRDDSSVVGVLDAGGDTDLSAIAVELSKAEASTIVFDQNVTLGSIPAVSSEFQTWADSVIHLIEVEGQDSYHGVVVLDTNLVEFIHPLLRTADAIHVFPAAESIDRLLETASAYAWSVAIRFDSADFIKWYIQRGRLDGVAWYDHQGSLSSETDLSFDSEPHLVSSIAPGDYEYVEIG